MIPESERPAAGDVGGSPPKPLANSFYKILPNFMRICYKSYTMRQKDSVRSCCGPFAQKQRRIVELEAAIKRLLKNVEGNQKAQASLELALAEKRAIIGWMGAHSCTPPVFPSGRPTRL
jgi:hypothetical protein